MYSCIAAPSRTPVVAHYNPLQIGFDEPEHRDEDGGLTVWQNQYPFGKSLFSVNTHRHARKRTHARIPNVSSRIAK